jgi:uncharacterized membrane protein YuzA (DUF378 family)
VRTVDVIATILVVIGALNWGLVGLFDVNVVHGLFGDSVIARLVYIIVGLAGIWEIAQWNAMHYRWTHPARTAHAA